jgi:hypothetical protein
MFGSLRPLNLEIDAARFAELLNARFKVAKQSNCPFAKRLAL